MISEVDFGVREYIDDHCSCFVNFPITFMVKKHVKPNGQDQTGGIVEKEAAIHVSNVMIIDPKTKKPTRIGHSIDKNNKKIRISKKSNEKFD